MTTKQAYTLKKQDNGKLVIQINQDLLHGIVLATTNMPGLCGLYDMQVENANILILFYRALQSFLPGFDPEKFAAFSDDRYKVGDPLATGITTALLPFQLSDSIDNNIKDSRITTRIILDALSITDTKNKVTFDLLIQLLLRGNSPGDMLIPNESIKETSFEIS